jgi:hypothetical protein
MAKRFVVISQAEIIRRIESPDNPRKSYFKLAIAFIYCSCSLFITSFTMVFVHDRVPDMDKYPPLPGKLITQPIHFIYLDLILDNLPYIPGAFELCEMIGMFMSCILITILVFHSYRTVILRRIFSIVGSVFLLRCCTMLLTSLSVPGSHLECSKLNYTTFEEKFWRAYQIWIHAGMSIQGVRTCGGKF